MEKNIRILEDNIALVTKKFQKNARIYGTAEYREWRTFISENPGYKMATKCIKKKEGKRTYRNKTYSNMEIYIKEMENSEKLLREFESIKNKAQIMPSPYHYVVAWFEETFSSEESYNAF